METVAGIVIGVIVVAALLWFFLFRDKGEGAGKLEAPTPEAKPSKKAEAPPAKAKPEPAKAAPAKAEPAAKPAAAKKAEAPVAKPAPAAEPEDEEEDEEEEEEEAAEPAAAAEPAVEAAPKKPAEPTKEAVEALRSGLDKTRGGFIARIAGLFRKKKEIDPELLNDLHEVLITADVGVKTSEKILENLRERMNNDGLSDEDAVWVALREEGRMILGKGQRDLRLPSSPSLILVVGVNGVGKTTTIGKLASRFKEQGKEVILAAGDTFRAAAVPQLEVWGRRVGCTVVKGKGKADPAAVVFDAVKKAQETGADIVIADTAGRLHTKSNLMEELKKVARSGEKALGRPVDEVLLVLDSTTGQNAIQQAAQFKDAIEVTGIALTKLDGTAKGGVILGIVDEHELPVHFIGVGERVEDLREFDAATFVQALFAKPDDETMAA
ncbi:MAG: signal recognition particle-docking protein FtsY [Sandaracinaceae bacterium]|nr:signal recognition particle-docking protein FtsY [Sandaracinaceae bacterium]